MLRGSKTIRNNKSETKRGLGKPRLRSMKRGKGLSVKKEILVTISQISSYPLLRTT